MSNSNDSHQHIVKTSSQWNDRSVEYLVIPRGCLCVELTPKGKTKIKVGEGNKFYSQLPYICDHEDLYDYYTKEEVDNIINNLEYMAIRSTNEYDSRNDLPIKGNKLGDVRFVRSQSPSIKEDPDTYVWNGSRWIMVGSPLQEIDLSEYVKRSEIEPRIRSLEEKAHVHYNKDVLDQTSAPYTVQEKEKLSTLENYDDTELREMIESIHFDTHTHDNKDILDQITDAWTSEDREKFDSLHNYDDTEVRERIETLEEASHTHENIEVLNNLTQDVIDNSHTHDNIEILDAIEEPYTTEEKEKLASLQVYDIFVGTDGYVAGKSGLVPQPLRTDKGKFLSSDGTWQDLPSAIDYIGATEEYDGYHGLVPAAMAGEQNYFLRGDGTWVDVALEGYNAGDGISFERGDTPETEDDLYIHNEGVLDITQSDPNNPNVITVQFRDDVTKDIIIPSGGTGSYVAGNGITIGASDDLICKNEEYYFDYAVQCQIRSDHLSPSLRTRTFTKLNASPALGAVMKFHHPQVTGDMISPMFVSTDPDAVAYNNSYDSMIMGALGPFRYLGKDWYYTSFDRGMEYGVGDLLGNMSSLTDNVYTYDTLVDAAKYLIDTAEPIIAQQISAKLGEGLTFDDTGAIELDETTKIKIFCNNDPD